MTTKRSKELDFVRGLAIIMVMGVHFRFPNANPVLNAIRAPFVQFGAAGVDLFFALSGFLVGGLLFREYVNTGQVKAQRFLVRRAMKIWPALYFLLIVHLIIKSHPPSTFLWQNLLHVQNYFGTSIAQTWSLAVEEHFYLGLAALMGIFAVKQASYRTIMILLGAISLLSFALRAEAIAAGDYDASYLHTQFRLDSLLIGVMLSGTYWMRRDIYDRIARQKTILLLLTAVTIIWMWFFYKDPVLGRLGFTLEAIGFCAFIVLVHQHSGRLTEWRIYRAIAWVGLYSYGIYLWHTVAFRPTAIVLARLEPLGLSSDIMWVLSLILQVGIAIPAGVIATHLVEWPALRLRDRLAPAKASPSEANSSFEAQDDRPENSRAAGPDAAIIAIARSDNP